MGIINKLYQMDSSGSLNEHSIGSSEVSNVESTIEFVRGGDFFVEKHSNGMVDIYCQSVYSDENRIDSDSFYSFEIQLDIAEYVQDIKKVEVTSLSPFYTNPVCTGDPDTGLFYVSGRYVPFMDEGATMNHEVNFYIHINGYWMDPISGEVTTPGTGGSTEEENGNTGGNTEDNGNTGGSVGGDPGGSEVLDNIGFFYNYSWTDQYDTIGYEIYLADQLYQGLSMGYCIEADGTVSEEPTDRTIWRPGDPLPNPGSVHNSLPVVSYSYLFCWISGTQYENWDLNHWDTKNVISLSGMFHYSGVAPAHIDISEWNVEKVKYADSMFSHSSQIETIVLPKFNGDNLEHIGSMFAYCSELSSLNFENIHFTFKEDSSQLFGMSDMNGVVYGCNNLVFETLDLSGFVFVDKSYSHQLYNQIINDLDKESLNEVIVLDETYSYYMRNQGYHEFESYDIQITAKEYDSSPAMISMGCIGDIAMSQNNSWWSSSQIPYPNTTSGRLEFVKTEDLPEGVDRSKDHFLDITMYLEEPTEEHLGVAYVNKDDETDTVYVHSHGPMILADSVFCIPSLDATGWNSHSYVNFDNISLKNATSINSLYAVHPNAESVTYVGEEKFKEMKLTSIEWGFSFAQQSIDFSNFDLSRVNNMSYAFYGARMENGIDFSSQNMASLETGEMYLAEAFWDAEILGANYAYNQTQADALNMEAEMYGHRFEVRGESPELKDFGGNTQSGVINAYETCNTVSYCGEIFNVIDIQEEKEYYDDNENLCTTKAALLYRTKEYSNSPGFPETYAFDSLGGVDWNTSEYAYYLNNQGELYEEADSLLKTKILTPSYNGAADIESYEKVFPLSSDEITYYGTAAPFGLMASNQTCWLRNAVSPYFVRAMRNNSFSFTELGPSNMIYSRPAMWVDISGNK